MKNLKLLSLLLITLQTTIFSQGEFLIQIDTSTGSFTKIGGPIDGINWVLPNIRTYDEKHGVYIFQGGLTIVDHLYSIDVTNGSIIYNPSYSQNLAREFKYDHTNDSLYGLYRDNSSSSLFMASISPSTGMLTSISNHSIPGLGGTIQGATAYDDTNHRYFAMSGNQLFSIDAISGTLISSPALGLSSGDQLTHFYYNSTLNTLNGLVQNSNTQLCYLVSINTETGAINKIGSGKTFGLGGGSSSIDKINQRYLFTYSTGGSTFYIATIDIATGQTISKQLIPLSSGSNIHSISFDNQRGKLFAIHWDPNATAVHDNIRSHKYMIYPVPTNDILQLESTTILGTIKIIDLTGNVIIQHSTTDTHAHIDVSNLRKGLYYIETNSHHYTFLKD